jgi:flagellar biosynthesis protein FliQ
MNIAKLYTSLVEQARKMGVSVISLIILVILVIGVGIPITDDVIAANNLTGLTATIVNFIPTFMALLVLVVVARGME